MVLQLLVAFEATQPAPIRIALLHRSSISQLKQEKIYWERFFIRFCEFIYGHTKCGDNYAASVFKTLKTFWNYLLIERGLPIGQFHKRFRIPQHNYPPLVLSPVQLSFLINNTSFQQSLPGNLRSSLDIFIVGCTIGLRYSDLMHLKKTSLQLTAEGAFLLLHTQKTRTALKLSIPDYVLAILTKYSKRKSKYLLPTLSATNFNLHVKQLAEKAGWVYPLPKIRYIKGKAVELFTKDKKSYRFCDHITAHTMRRTAITTLLMLDVPENMVRRISGHADGSKEFYRYVSIVQDYLNEKVMNAYSRLKNIEKKA